LNVIIHKFPLLVAACPPDSQNTIIKTVLDPKIQNSVTLLLASSICEAKSTRNLVPINLHLYLLSLLTSRHASLLQLVSECAGLFARMHPDSFFDLFAYAETHPSRASCILLSSVFAHFPVPTPFLTRALIFLDSQLKNGTTGGVAVHAMTSLVLTSSMQLSAVGTVASTQFTQLFELIHRSYSIQPVSLHIIADCFRVFLEHFSSELREHSSIVLLILRSIAHTPVSSAREIYFESCRTIYLFANFLSESAPIAFPASRGAVANLQLAACEAFADLLKFRFVDLDIAATVPRVLALLQQTGDARASHLINSLAGLLTGRELPFWVATGRRVLVTSSLVDSTSLAIDPSQEVKRACVSALAYVVDQLVVTEHLDDVVSALCRATETGTVQLQEAAFPVLQRVISAFRSKTNDDGVRLLDLYDSQFAAVIRTGFQLPLSVSGGFLSAYLRFNTDGMARDPENCAAILVVYLRSLDGCGQRTPAFYGLASHLCWVGRRYASVQPLIDRFLQTLAPIFADLVLRAMALWNPQGDWRRMREFRALAGDLYAELLPAFVWLQSRAGAIVPIGVIVSFLVIEVARAREEWIARASFEALLVAVDLGGRDLQPELLELALKVALAHSERGAELLTGAAALLRAGGEWDSLRMALVALAFERPHRPALFGYLLKSDDRKTLRKFAFAIGACVVDRYRNGQVSIDEAAALFVLLFRHSPEVVGAVCEHAIAAKHVAASFKLMVVNLAFRAPALALGGIPRFLLSVFKKGGMHLIGQTLIRRPPLGIALLSKGAAKAAFLLALKDAENVRAYLWFIQLALAVLRTQEADIAAGFARAAARLVLAAIEKWHADPLNGRAIVWHCVRIVREVAEVVKLEEVIGGEVGEELIRMLGEQVEGEIQVRKMQELVEFSTNERGRRQSEWSTLEIADSD
jgi:hypothetical protein